MASDIQLFVALKQPFIRRYSFGLEPNATVNAEQASLFAQILRSRDTPAAVFGWPSVHEGSGTTAASKAGCYVMCAAAENLGFMASVAVDDETKLRLPGTATTRPLNRSRNYVSINAWLSPRLPTRSDDCVDNR